MTVVVTYFKIYVYLNGGSEKDHRTTVTIPNETQNVCNMKHNHSSTNKQHHDLQTCKWSRPVVHAMLE